MNKRAVTVQLPSHLILAVHDLATEQKVTLAHGYYIEIAWGGLSLHTETSGQWLCNTTDLGFSHATFLRRFGPGKPRNPRQAQGAQSGTRRA